MERIRFSKEPREEFKNLPFNLFNVTDPRERAFKMCDFFNKIENHFNDEMKIILADYIIKLLRNNINFKISIE